MKIQFDKIETKKNSITVFDGERDIIITKDNFQRYLSQKNAIPINGIVPNLETLTITGDSVHKVTFSPEQNQKQIDLNKNYITVPAMTFAELQAYTFDPSKKYRVHLNQDCMNNASDSVSSPLPSLLSSKENIVDVVITGDVDTVGILGSNDFLENIIIEEGVHYIRGYSFSYCPNLKTITIPVSVTEIYRDAFCDSPAKDIFYGGTMEQWSLIYIDAGKYGSTIPIKSNIHCIDGNIIYNYIKIPAMSFAELQTYNFEYDKNYEIHINQDCMSHGNGTMEDPTNELQTFISSKTNITDVIIDNDVTSIGIGALMYCRSLTSVNIPDGVTKIGRSAFCYCMSLKTINIPDGVTSIGSSAFHGCGNLTSVTIPDSVTSIGGSAFRHCEISYNGTKEQWSSILQNSEIYECIVHCTNGDIICPPETM